MSDNEGDSQMLSSASHAGEEEDHFPQSTTTTVHTPLDPATLSPPNSQGGVSLHTANTRTSLPLANSNGKRPIHSLDGIDSTAITSNGTSAATTGIYIYKFTHQPSGYTWSRPEDEPGHSWQSRKAQDEAGRVWDGLLDRDKRIGDRYPDPFETADRELAVLDSMAKSSPT